MREVSIAALGSTESFTTGTNFTAWAILSERAALLRYSKSLDRSDFPLRLTIPFATEVGKIAVTGGSSIFFTILRLIPSGEVLQ